MCQPCRRLTTVWTPGLVALPRRHILGVRRIQAVHPPLRCERQRIGPRFTVPRITAAEAFAANPNQGMEGRSLSTVMPNGSTLAGIMQPALNTPGLQGTAESALLTRLVGANLATKAVKAY